MPDPLPQSTRPSPRPESTVPASLQRPSLSERFRHLTGSNVDHDLRPLSAWLEGIIARGPALARAGLSELEDRAASAGDRLRQGDAPDGLLVETFALVRELAQRLIGLRPHRVQLLAGMGLHLGRIVEMQTGEGKTLAAVAPVILNALGGEPVQVMTVNDYLARRDAAWMGPVYRIFGLAVGVIQEGMGAEERRRAYACGVTYLTAREAGFDCLRDGLCLEADDRVQGPEGLVVVDEADSVLIDEARLPLVIAGDRDESGGGLTRLARLVERLEPERHFHTDEYARNINLSADGARFCEAELGCPNLFEAEQAPLLAELTNALHAHRFLRRDVDYIVRQETVELVDEFTGRVADRRRWPDGLQAAVETREGLRCKPEGRILGTLTMQHFIGRYPRVSGMTATAQPAAAEFREFYDLEVLVIPTNRPCVREDHPDLVFTHREAKQEALLAEIIGVQRSGRPVLVGTGSVAESEELSRALAEAGIDCAVLNAKNHEREARIVARAGRPGAVTISTNMAGRGTDIRLGGQDEEDRDAVVALGGLYVIGTNRHESLRVDLQLRGRAGRQGDPGSSRFFISLEDDLVQRFGLRDLIPAARFPRKDPAPLADRRVNREIERVQRIVEGQNFEARRTLWQYSVVLEVQRRQIMDWRERILLDEERPALLAHRSAARYLALEREVGADLLRSVEKRLTLVMVDLCWSDYLEETNRFRDGIHLIGLGGRDPYTEFHNRAREAYRALLDRIDDEIVNAFESLEVTRDGVDWERAGLDGPSATWTYLVTDRPFESGPLAALARRPSLGLPLALIYSPFWIIWSFFRFLQKRRQRRGRN